MQSNETIRDGKWLEIKGNIQKAWGRITDSELEKTKGDLKTIGGLIKQKYGENYDNAEKKLADMFKDFNTSKDHMMTDIKDNLKK